MADLHPITAARLGVESSKYLAICAMLAQQVPEHPVTDSDGRRVLGRSWRSDGSVAWLSLTWKLVGVHRRNVSSFWVMEIVVWGVHRNGAGVSQ
jgi:hypothetical protein